MAVPDDERPVEIVPFDRRYDRAAFDCGELSVNEWFRKQAGQSDKRNAPRTFLAVQGKTVAGFYCLVTRDLVPDEHASAFGLGKGRRYPVPGVLIAQLGVSTAFQSRGIGKLLLVDALERILRASEDVGFELVLVDALNSEVSAFYRKMQFESFADNPLRLFITVSKLRATFEAAD